MTVISANKLSAIDHRAPRLDPPKGLLDVVAWEPSDGPPRWLDSGVLVERTNFDGDDGYELWTEGWCSPASLVTQDKGNHQGRPPRDDTPFMGATGYAWSKSECGDLHTDEMARTRERSASKLARRFPKTIEDAFITRVLSDRTEFGVTTDTVADIVEAFSSLEEDIMDLSVGTALIHAAPKWASIALAARALQLKGGGLYTALGYQVVFAAGYKTELDNTLVATTPVWGWQTDVEHHEDTVHLQNQFVSVDEKSVLLAYEAVLAAATIT